MKTLLLASLFALATIGVAQEVKIAPSKANIKWEAKKVTGEHWGNVSLKSGSLTLKNNQIVGGKFEVDMTSITVKDLEPGTYNDKLTGHLKSDDFFGVEKFPVASIEIQSSSIFVDNKATVKALLTIKGITNPIEFNVEKSESSYSTKLIINRAKYDVKYGSGSFYDGLGDKMIYDDFTLDISLKM